MKVVIIKLGALGDVLMATPLIKTLTDAYLGRELWLLTSHAFAPLFKHWPGLRVQVAERHGIRASVSAVWWLRRQGFSRLYDLQSNDRTRIWCALSGIKERVGNHPYYPYTHHPPDQYSGQTHAFERLNQVLMTAGHPSSLAAPTLPRDPQAITVVDDWMAKYHLRQQPMVLLHAGASIRHPAKRWPHFLELARYLNKQGYAIVWIGAAEDAALNAELAKQIGINATSQFTVTALAELGARARFAVTNDSAPMHILACAGIPVFGLFGPTDWRRTHALGQRARIISLDQALTREMCPDAARELANLPVVMVIERLRQAGLL